MPKLIRIIIRRPYDLGGSLILHRSPAIKTPANSCLVALGLTTQTTKDVREALDSGFFDQVIQQLSYKAPFKVS